MWVSLHLRENQVPALVLFLPVGSRHGGAAGAPGSAPSREARAQVCACGGCGAAALRPSRGPRLDGGPRRELRSSHGVCARAPLGRGGRGAVGNARLGARSCACLCLKFNCSLLSARPLPPPPAVHSSPRAPARGGSMRAAARRLLPARARRPTWKPPGGARSHRPNKPKAERAERALCAGGRWVLAREERAPAGQAARAPPLSPRGASSCGWAGPTVAVVTQLFPYLVLCPYPRICSAPPASG